jgi:hypothetical protein
MLQCIPAAAVPTPKQYCHHNTTATMLLQTSDGNTAPPQFSHAAKMSLMQQNLQ